MLWVGDSYSFENEIAAFVEVFEEAYNGERRLSGCKAKVFEESLRLHREVVTEACGTFEQLNSGLENFARKGRNCSAVALFAAAFLFPFKILVLPTALATGAFQIMLSMTSPKERIRSDKDLKKALLAALKAKGIKIPSSLSLETWLKTLSLGLSPLALEKVSILREEHEYFNQKVRDLLVLVERFDDEEGNRLSAEKNVLESILKASMGWKPSNRRIKDWLNIIQRYEMVESSIAGKSMLFRDFERSTRLGELVFDQIYLTLVTETTFYDWLSSGENTKLTFKELELKYISDPNPSGRIAGLAELKIRYDVLDGVEESKGHEFSYRFSTNARSARSLLASEAEWKARIVAHIKNSVQDLEWREPSSAIATECEGSLLLEEREDSSPDDGLMLRE